MVRPCSRTPTNSAPTAVPKAFGFAAPSTAKPMRAAATESSSEIVTRCDVAASKPCSEQNAADRGENTGNHIGPDLVGLDRRAGELGCALRLEPTAYIILPEAGVFEEEPDQHARGSSRTTTETGSRFGQDEIEAVPAERQEAGLKVPLAIEPSGMVMPVAIERPSVGMRCSPTSRNIMPSVAQKVRHAHVDDEDAVDQSDHNADRRGRQPSR